jgi:NAD(P)-dependent dehydrogenase (short-subunit alcohol dehydrogenase family)
MLTEKTIVVIGGAGLLGRRFVTAIAERGGTAIIADRNLAAARRVSEETDVSLRKHLDVAEVDITDRASLDAIIELTVKRHGRIDGVVSSAYPRNKNYGRRLEDVTYEDFYDNLGMHVGGYFLVAQRFGSFFQSQRSGSIINIGSIYGVMAPRFDVYDGTTMTMPVEYAAIKAGIIQLTRYFAQYFKRDGVRVNTLSPGGIFDNQPATFTEAYRSYAGQKGMLVPDDIVGALAFLLSDDSRFVTGQNIVVDDGFSL